MLTGPKRTFAVGSAVSMENSSSSAISVTIRLVPTASSPTGVSPGGAGTAKVRTGERGGLPPKISNGKPC